ATATATTPMLLPVVPAIAPPVVAQSMDWLSDALKKPHADYTARSEAKSVGEFYIIHESQGAVAPRYGCLIAVRGSFGMRAGHGESTSQSSPLWTRENLAKVGLARPPALYIELRIEYLGGPPPTHMALRPVFLDYRATAASKTGASRRK